MEGKSEKWQSGRKSTSVRHIRLVRLFVIEMVKEMGQNAYVGQEIM
jgi:hypothetical protein